MQFHINVVKATHVPSMDIISKSDPFVVLIPSFSDKKVQTKVIDDNDSPEWNESFSFALKNEEEDYFTAELYDYDDVGQHDLIASLKIYVRDFIEGFVVQKIYQMEPAKGIKQIPNLVLRFHLAVRGREKFVPYQIITSNIVH